MKELCAFQAHAIAASQSHLASLIDHRTLVSNQDVTQFKKFNIGDYVLVLNHSKSKLNFKWRGPYQIVRRNEANIYTCKDLHTNVELQFDVTALKLFVCPPDVDPVSIAGLDEDEFVVRAILDHRLEGENRKLRTHYYFKVLFADNTDDWLPYYEVRDAFEE